MKNLKIFPKTFITQTIILTIVILIAHGLIFLFMPFAYQKQKESELNNLTTNFLTSINNKELDEIKNIANTFSKNNNLNITLEIDGKKDDGTVTNQGVALYAKNDGIIFANGTSLANGLYMKVKDGASAIVSDGATSNVEARYSTIDYDGNGYALYSVNDGNIDVRNSKISLYGNSTGFERSGDLANPFPIKLTDAKFYVNSKDAVIMNLKNIPSLNFSTLANTLFQGTLNGAEVHVASGIKNYKLATIDGLASFDIDSNYDKSRALNPANEKTNDYVLTRHLLMQRAKINLKSGNNVRAILSSSDIADLGEQTAVGLANYVGDEINLETNTSVNVDRTDKASGAVSVGSVGLFADGGRVNVASGATINVEKENNFVNGSSVGIYASNGAAVSNAGTVNVGGKGSIGILSMTRRIDPDGNPLPGGSTLSMLLEVQELMLKI